MPAAQPLTGAEKRQLLLMLQEAQSRGIEIPKEIANQFSQNAEPKNIEWPLDENGWFVGNDGSRFNPNETMRNFVLDDARYVAAFSGRGGGKTCAACQKVLHKIKNGESGVVISPTFENFKYSTWPELKKWIPWNCVVPSQRNRRLPQWQPQAPFVIVFLNGAKMSLKGLKNADGARGSNVNWFWYDESGMDKDGLAWQLANASVRIGDKPQAFTTTTPKGMGHWLYKFFISQDFGEGAKEEFDKVSDGREFLKVYKTTTYDNRANLDPAFFASCLATYPSGYLREQELNGEFANEGGKIGDRTWFREKMLVEIPEEWVIEKKVRYWDMAASSQKVVNGKKTNDPDSSVGSLLSKTKERAYKIVVENQVAGKWKWEELKPKIVETARQDGMYVTVCIEEEPGSGGKNQVAEMQMHFKELGMIEWKVVGQRPTDRLIEANTWFALAAAGRVYVVRGEWNEDFLNEVDGFTQILHDDRCTSVSGGVRFLSPFKSFRTQGFLTV
jgi:predicted phage terminase large subunit-like protein